MATALLNAIADGSLLAGRALALPLVDVFVSKYLLHILVKLSHNGYYASLMINSEDISIVQLTLDLFVFFGKQNRHKLQ